MQHNPPTQYKIFHKKIYFLPNIIRSIIIIFQSQYISEKALNFYLLNQSSSIILPEQCSINYFKKSDYVCIYLDASVAFPNNSTQSKGRNKIDRRFNRKRKKDFRIEHDITAP